MNEVFRRCPYEQLKSRAVCLIINIRMARLIMA
jgi:hypothetical protein